MSTKTRVTGNNLILHKALHLTMITWLFKFDVTAENGWSFLEEQATLSQRLPETICHIEMTPVDHTGAENMFTSMGALMTEVFSNILKLSGRV